MERRACSALLAIIALTSFVGVVRAENAPPGPYDRQVAENVTKLDATSPIVRAGAAEALGFLRAYSVEQPLVGRLDDSSADVRRQAAMALAWCGGRRAIPALLNALDDEDWAVRQGSHVALTNLTGMEFPFDALIPSSERAEKTKIWRDWWTTVPAGRPPREVFDLLIEPHTPSGTELDEPLAWRLERGLRALGVFGGQGATEAILRVLGNAPPEEPDFRPVVRAGIRSLGRLRDERTFHALTGYLDNTMWARSAADALGDRGDRRAVGPLLEAYPKFAKQLDGKYPERLPDDDNWGGPPSDIAEDRMLETPFWISYALGRLPLDDPDDRHRLRQLAPLIMANLPRDHDRAMLYQPASPAVLTRHLMRASGLRQEACEHAFLLLGQPRRVPKPDACPQWPVPPGYGYQSAEEREGICISTWLPVLCTEAEDVPRLIALLEHEEGWVRINAAKTLAWRGDGRAVEPISRLLAQAKAEADFGYCGTFKFDEYNDPTPRWREAFVRALGLLGAQQYTSLLAKILRDDRSSLGVRYAATQALGDLLACGENQQAVAVLSEAAAGHVFESVRHLARDSLRREGIDHLQISSPSRETPTVQQAAYPKSHSKTLEAIVFLKGDNLMHNDVGTVELADRWRRTYVYTDPGPTYRPARNLHILQPPRPDGTVTPLTTFPDGYVADPEISWDATEMIFSRRGQDDPWWHVWRIKLDGTGLVQVTDGPYHDVGPAYLPDGRIVFSSTRSGIRDEYHGYQCNALYVMNRDGNRMKRIATNAGRDNEPTVLADGRVAFCRLEMFYARIKTELTLHAIHPDGTQDVVLYGPERRDYWHNLDYGPRSRLGMVENPAMFGVLRMTQPQPMPDGRRIVIATQAGLALVGGLRDGEQIVTPDNKTRVYTTPFPLPDGRLLHFQVLDSDRRVVGNQLTWIYPRGGETKSCVGCHENPHTTTRGNNPLALRTSPASLLPNGDEFNYRAKAWMKGYLPPEVEERMRTVRAVNLLGR